MRIIYLPIEPLEERYSAQYLKWFPSEFEKQGINYLSIQPQPLSDKIRDGSFLDVCGTNYYKSMQIAEVCKMAYEGSISDDDVIFLGDAWHTGLEGLAYIRDALNLKFKIVGLLFAGSYDPFDFLNKKNMSYWAEDLENSWFKIVDKLFMATEFHRRLVMSTRKIDPKKLVVTGHPICLEDFPETKKENIVVFPHRLDSEKNPFLFSKMKTKLKGPANHYEFLVTKEVTKNKEEYYKLLSRSMISVSFADQETYGFAMVESIAANCIPIVPNRLSYTEMYYPEFTYHSFNEACDLVYDIIYNYEKYKKLMLDNRKDILSKARSAISCMIRECIT